MLEEEDQMGLFEMAGAKPDLKIRELRQPPPSSSKPAQTPSGKAASPRPVKPAQPPTPAAQPARKKVAAPRAVPAPAAKKVSGLVPDGDVRLTANIRQDLHLKLKIASAHRRTTIGEILEELIEQCLQG